jgi:hypothetical protein
MNRLNVARLVGSVALSFFLASGSSSSSLAAELISPDCGNAKPVTINTGQLAAVFKTLSASTGSEKTEFESMNDYILRRQVTLDAILAKSNFKCPKLEVRIPLQWKYSVEKSNITVVEYQFNDERDVSLGELNDAIGENKGSLDKTSHDSIFVEKFGAPWNDFDKIDVNFSSVIRRYGVAPKPKSTRKIANCVANSSGNLFMSYELQVMYCRQVDWDIHLLIEDPNVLTGRESFSATVDEAKQYRNTGLFAYATVRLSKNYYAIEDYANQQFLYSQLESLYIGDVSGHVIYKFEPKSEKTTESIYR